MTGVKGENHFHTTENLIREQKEETGRVACIEKRHPEDCGMDNIKGIVEATAELDRLIQRLAKVRELKRQLSKEDKSLAEEIKGLVDLSLFDEIIARRDDKMVSLAHFRDQSPRFDIARFKTDHRELYEQYLKMPDKPNKVLYLSRNALIQQ